MTAPARPAPGSAITVDAVSKFFRLERDRAPSLKHGLLDKMRRRPPLEFWALRDVSFDVPQGSMFGLIGHNGSGKSTLLRCIAGIYRPTSGKITTHGRISALLELGSGFHPDLSGRENVYLNAAILGLTDREIDAVFDDIVDFAGVGEFIDSPVRVYSSGMFVRLGFAVAVHVHPELLIIDEVIAVGDEEFQRRCFEHLYSLRQQGATIVVVSHSLGLIQSMCDRAAWLDHGRLKVVGTAGEVAAAYLDEVNRQAGAAPGLALTDPDARPGSGEIRITAVEIVDEAGQINNEPLRGAPVRFRFSYRSREPVADPVIGFNLHTENALHITGESTRMGGLSLGTVDGEGAVEFVLDSLPLNPGRYDVGVVIADAHGQHNFDQVDKAVHLVVRDRGGLGRTGLVTLGGRWTPVP